MSVRQEAGGGREAQRRRTRRTLVDAARDLLAAGGPAPTVDAVAAAADVSRRTVYMHFPTLDQLLLDAALGALSEAYVGTALAATDGGAAGQDVGARVEALVRAVLATGPATLPLGRQIIRLTVDRPGAARGHRRVAWIEAAVAPLAERLGPERHERLVSALSMVVGFEAMVVLQDVRRLDAEAEVRTAVWAARALVDAAVAELEEPVE